MIQLMCLFMYLFENKYISIHTTMVMDCYQTTRESTRKMADLHMHASILRGSLERNSMWPRKLIRLHRVRFRLLLLHVFTSFQ
jgi:hypothetical protein